MMKKVGTLAMTILCFTFGVVAQITTPAASPAGSVYSQVGLTDVTVDYFRPKVKGRKIFGEGSDFLQPYGQLWRTGANSGSKLTLSTKATIAGTEVEAGTYLILSVPGKDEFEFILYSDPSVGGNMSNVTDDKKVLTTKVKVITPATPVEALTFGISDISADNTKANLWFGWADVTFTVPIEVSYDDIVMRQIANLTGQYMQAASYYLETGRDLEQALAWVDQYLAIEGNSSQFWNVFTKARIQAELGMKKEAISTAEEVIATAKANQGGDFGYVKRSEDLIAGLKKK